MPLALQVVPGFVLLASVHFFPESPRWLVARDKSESAVEVIRRLHIDGSNPNSVQAEFEEIVGQIQKDKVLAPVRGYRQVFRKRSWRKRIFLGAGIWVMLNFTGVNVRALLCKLTQYQSLTIKPGRQLLRNILL